MARAFVLAALIAVVGLVSFSQPPRTDAAQHFMRVYGVMGGALNQTGADSIQSVELRMTSSFQNQTAGHHVCFYDGDGDPWARFTFPSPNPPNFASGASILIATTGFNNAWAHTPDFSFSAINTQAVGGSAANPLRPIAFPAGKVTFGFDSATDPMLMCQTLSVYDSVAYGSTYAGTAVYPDPFEADLTTTGTDAIQLQGALCNPCARANDVDYGSTLIDVNGSPADYPRNNAGQTAQILIADLDGDGVIDGSDNCPAWPNPGQGLPGWPVPSGDIDCDGFTDSNESSIGTTVADACGFTAGAPGESENWPPDMVETNNIQIQDVLAMKPHIGSGLARYDLVVSGTVNIQDVLAVKPFFGFSCTP
ncbi:MAG: thrombospondin type 3 repeat-containing protein [Dehalococcoidia bacterium]